MRGKEIPFKNINSIQEALSNTVTQHSALPCYRIRRGDDFETYTFEQTLNFIKKIAQFLKQNGFNPGDRAAVIGENCPEWAFSHLGILWAGGIVVPLDVKSTPSEWAHLMRHSECKFLFISSDYYEDIIEQRKTIPSLLKIVPFSKSAPEPNLPSIFRATGKLPDLERRSRNDIAIIIYTSGTTGASKGVMLTHGNILSNIEQALMALDLSHQDSFLSVLPMHHSFEGTAGFLLPMVIGASGTFATSLKSKELIADLLDSKPTAFLVVPLILEKFYQGIEKNLKNSSFLKKGAFHGLMVLAKTMNPMMNGRASKRLFQTVRAAMGLGHLRFLISGGAALHRSLSIIFEDLGFPIFQGYGISETSPFLSVNIPGRCRNASVGRILPGIEAKIDRPGPDGIGEIVVKCPNVMKGYYKNETATAEVIKDGWFYTGDLGRLDQDGFLYITGRKKSVIVTKGGKNIHPEEIEEKLNESSYIKESLVLAKIHPRTQNEEIHALIYPDPEVLDEYEQKNRIVIDEKTIEHLIEKHIEKINKHLADYKRIRSFSVRDEAFPKTHTQKIKRYLFEEGGIEIKR